MDIKTLEYMKERVEKASRLVKAIEYRKEKINLLVNSTFNKYGAVRFSDTSIGDFTVYLLDNSGVDLPNGFIFKLRAAAIGLLEEEIVELQRQLDEL